MVRELRFGSRDSALARIQARLVMDPIARAHPELKLSLVTVKTLGDLRQDLPLEGAQGKALFTGALEEALARGEIDLCVHSLKDMPERVSPDFPIAAMTRREDPRDMLLLPRGQSFTGLDALGEISVGCSSVRRRVQLAVLAPRLRAAPVRGNVPTRLDKLDRGQYGALILAAAGLIRLGIGDRPGRVFSVEEMVPAPGQGILAVQGRRGEDHAFLGAVHDRISAEEALAERGFVEAIGGGCGSPVAAHARVSGGGMVITGMYGAEDGAFLFRDSLSGPRGEGRALAEKLARRLMERPGEYPGEYPGGRPL
jgi:hydroxymethylbilane synthase